MKYHMHIPKLLEFALNVVCDDITLHGKQCLISPIPYPLYLRCIMTYADKYDKSRYSTYRFYRDIRCNGEYDVQIGRLYPNVLDHIVLDDDDDVKAYTIATVSRSYLIDDAAASIQRFASRCLAADKSESMENAMSQVLSYSYPMHQPILDVLIFYGAKLDPNDGDYFTNACIRGLRDDVRQAIDKGHVVSDHDAIRYTIGSGNCDTIICVHEAYEGDKQRQITQLDLHLYNATVQSMELCMSLNIIQRGTHYMFSKIPSLSVLQWILDHDVMEHDFVLIDIASSASRYSGHYFDMLRYLIEQRNFTVPRDILIKIEREDNIQNPVRISDLDVFDYLLLRGADVNAEKFGENVLERFPMLIRYWIDKGLVVKSDDANTMRKCIESGMTVPVLEMMIDKYSMDVNEYSYNGNSPFHYACRRDYYEIVKMMIHHGADVNKRDREDMTPYAMAHDDAIKRLLIQHGYRRTPNDDGGGRHVRESWLFN